MIKNNALQVLNDKVIKCRLCPRLVQFRETVKPRAAFQDQIYWRKPVPGFGDPNAWLMVLGLAPAADGGNRTGRVFTGDATARFLYKAFYKMGFSNMPTSESIDDGLILKGCYLTAAVKCVPPDNKPSRQELLNCSQYYHQELHLLTNVSCVLTLGKFAFDAYLLYLKSLGVNTKDCQFSHGAHFEFQDLPDLYASYHPSPQNTNTGKMTEEMFLNLLKIIKNRHRK
jgi:uracil-DNA glycosylase